MLIGGDEVSFPAVEHLPEVAAALKTHRLAAVSDLYRLFITTMQSYAVVGHGRRPTPTPHVCSSAVSVGGSRT